MLARVYDPSPIPHDQQDILANVKTTTDTIPAEQTLGFGEGEDRVAMGESSASKRATAFAFAFVPFLDSPQYLTRGGHVALRRCPTREGRTTAECLRANTSRTENSIH